MMRMDLVRTVMRNRNQLKDNLAMLDHVQIGNMGTGHRYAYTKYMYGLRALYAVLSKSC